LLLKNQALIKTSVLVNPFFPITLFACVSKKNTCVFSFRTKIGSLGELEKRLLSTPKTQSCEDLRYLVKMVKVVLNRLLEDNDELRQVGRELNDEDDEEEEEVDAEMQG
jgi:hypothetical protein